MLQLPTTSLLPDSALSHYFLALPRSTSIPHVRQVTVADDPFAPFWPGEAYVDWVGTSIYWWGVDPEDGSLGNNLLPYGDLVFGTIFKVTYDDLVTYGKPIMIAETGAVYNDNQVATGQPSEAIIKNAYIDSVFNLDPENGPTL